jgi:hypothetical protein
MKFFSTLILFGLFAHFSSCSSPAGTEKPEKQEAPSIVRKWKLQSHENKSFAGDKLDLSSQPTDIILSLRQEGYFVIYDTFTDPRFKTPGLNRIQQRSKGQWKQEGDKLILHHTNGDSSYTEELYVTELNKNTLVTKGKDKKSLIYKTYGGY